MASRGLQINEHIEFQRRYWRVERIAWVCMGVAVLVAASGVFGGVGPLSDAVASTGDVRVEYGRFERMQSPISVRIRGGAATDAAPRLWISREYMDAITIERITPEPESMATRDDGVEVRFAPSTAPLDVLIEGKASRPGQRRGVVEVNGSLVRFSQFIYP